MITVTTRNSFVSVMSVLGLLAATLAMIVGTAAPAHGATFTVTTTADTTDLAPGDGECLDAAGFCSLRAAIQEANTLPGADVVTLPPGTYVLSRPGTGEDASVDGDLDILYSITIAGSGSANTTIVQTVAEGVLHVIGAQALTAHFVRDVTIAGGNALGGFGGGIRHSDVEDYSTLELTNVAVTGNYASALGGGIFNEDGLILNNVVISNNTAGIIGGGMWNNTGGGVPMTINGGTITANHANDGGGGIYSFGGLMTITGTAISNNGADLDLNDVGDGGGIHVAGGTVTLTSAMIGNGNNASSGGGVYVTDGTVSINGSIIGSNSATLNGGGVSGAGGSSVRISDSTLADNSANFDGGGLYAGQDGIVTMTNTTVSGNQVDPDPPNFGEGGGIFYGSTATSTITDSTIGNSNSANGGGGISVEAGTLNIMRTDVSSNSAVGKGGVFINSFGTVNITDSTISGNTAIFPSGGIGSLGNLTLINSTVSDNVGLLGGGLAVWSGTSKLTNVTIRGNSADEGGGILVAGGTMIGHGLTVTANNASVAAGIDVTSSSLATLGGSIVAGNIDSSGVLNPDCRSTSTANLISDSYLLLGNNSDCLYTGGVGDQVGTAAAPIDPLLGPLAANGSSGPLTHALLPGSPALNAVPPATCSALWAPSTTDARKVPRPQGVGCDIGAYEAQLPTEAGDVYTTQGVLSVPAPGVLGNDNNPEAGLMTAAKVTDPAHGTLTFASDGSFTYKPTADFTGTDSFTYRASNIAGSVNTQTVTITVTAPPPPPPPPPSPPVVLPGTLTPVPHDVGLVDPVSGMWHLRKASSGAITSFTYGVPGDIPFMGDWDCNGTETPGLYRQSDGFAYIRNSNTFGVADVTFFMGNPSDIPLAGDFNGDGCDTVSIYRPGEQRIYIANTLGANNGAISADFSYIFGNPGDKPFVGDFNGNGSETIGLHRESTGFVYFRNTHTIGFADVDYFFGDPGDRLVAGDWGVVDGVFTPAVFRPPQETFYFRHTNTQGNADSQFVWPQSNASTWRPVSGVMGL